MGGKRPKRLWTRSREHRYQILRTMAQRRPLSEKQKLRLEEWSRLRSEIAGHMAATDDNTQPLPARGSLAPASAQLRPKTGEGPNPPPSAPATMEITASQ